MKKFAIIMSLASLVLVSTPALAKENHGLKLGLKNELFGDNSNQFLVAGTIASVGTNSFVVNALGVANVANVTNGQVTILVNSTTKFTGTTVAGSLTTPDSGKKVLVSGASGSTTLTATSVKILGNNKDNDEPKEHTKNNKAVGEVTAVTANSVTIKNNLTGDTKTITTDASTKVSVDGVSKTVADVQVGDKGWVRFKTVGTAFIAKFIHLFR